MVRQTVKCILFITLLGTWFYLCGECLDLVDKPSDLCVLGGMLGSIAATVALFWLTLMIFNKRKD